MAITLKQDEAIPSAYPTAEQDAIWQRIEHYTACRWTPRQVVWTVEGAGDWKPLLSPVEVTLVEEWQGDAWQAVDAPVGPYGLRFGHDSTWRVTATVGANTSAPVAVLEAVERLAGYSAEIGKADESHGQLVSNSMNLGGELQLTHRYERNWTGRALQLSGAADLLRPYRGINNVAI